LLLNGQVLNGQVLNGQVLNGQVLNGQVLNGQVLNGQVLQHALMLGKIEVLVFTTEHQMLEHCSFLLISIDYEKLFFDLL
jgi:hypothetical protein